MLVLGWIHAKATENSSVLPTNYVLKMYTGTMVQKSKGSKAGSATRTVHGLQYQYSDRSVLRVYAEGTAL